jgi:hypothetical protein
MADESKDLHFFPLHSHNTFVILTLSAVKRKDLRWL